MTETKAPPSANVSKRIEEARAFKDAGNKYFSEGKLPEALKEWHMCMLNAAGIDSLASQYGTQSSEEQNKDAKELVKSVQNNFCAAYIKQEKWDKVVIAASKVIKMSPEDEPNTKALYRRAQAYHNLGESQKAAQDLDVAMNKAPQDPAIRALAAQIAKAATAAENESAAKLRGFLNK